MGRELVLVNKTNSSFAESNLFVDDMQFQKGAIFS